MSLIRCCKVGGNLSPLVIRISQRFLIQPDLSTSSEAEEGGYHTDRKQAKGSEGYNRLIQSSWRRY